MVELEPSVAARDLVKRYVPRRGVAPVAALDRLTLTLGAGRAALLAGPNGAGKSTALRLMSGIDAPTSGSVAILGHPPRAMAVRRRIGYLADSSDLFPFLDARETLEFFAASANLGRAERRDRSERLSERLGLAAFGKKRVKAYSMGMRRRLGLACVLIGQPDVLLLDEPISGLDPEGMNLFVELMREEKARGAALVFSSHHLGHAEELSDEVFVLDRGAVVLSGGVADIARAVGERELRVTDLDDAGWARIREEIASLGGRVVGERVSRAALERHLLGRERPEDD